LDKRILAVASAGGHWEQMRLLQPAFGGEVHFLSTRPGQTIGGRPVPVVRDCNRRTPWRAVLCTIQLWGKVGALRPDLVVSTGALPGLLALLVARLQRRRTVWIDSVANAERLSASGRMALRFADLCLTQWPHLERPEGPRYLGSLL